MLHRFQQGNATTQKELHYLNSFSAPFSSNDQEVYHESLLKSSRDFAKRPKTRVPEASILRKQKGPKTKRM
jgi:hypothetical protein